MNNLKRFASFGAEVGLSRCEESALPLSVYAKDLASANPFPPPLIIPIKVSAKTVAAKATSMMVKPRADRNFRFSGNSRTFRDMRRTGRRVKLIWMGIEANRNIITNFRLGIAAK